MDGMKNSTGIKEDHVIHISGCFSAEKNLQTVCCKWKKRPMVTKRPHAL